MNYKPTENDLMDFLYGELEGAEKEKVEKYLLENPQARLELEQLRNVRSVLSNVKDKEVIAPPIFVDDSKQPALWETPYLKTIVGIAASLILVIMVGRFSGLRIRYGESELRIGFGNAQQAEPVRTSTPTAGLSPEEVQSMINSSLHENNEVMQTSWKQTQQGLDASISRNLAISSGKIDKLVRESSTASQEQFKQFVSGMQTENLQLVKNYFKV
jgi:hypothetical protein